MKPAQVPQFNYCIFHFIMQVPHFNVRPLRSPADVQHLHLWQQPLGGAVLLRLRVQRGIGRRRRDARGVPRSRGRGGRAPGWIIYFFLLNETFSTFHSYDTCVFLKKIIAGADSTKKTIGWKTIGMSILAFPELEGKVSILYWELIFFLSGLHPRSSQRHHHHQHHHLNSNRDFSRGNPVYDLAVQQQQQQQQQQHLHHQQQQQQQYPYGTVTSNSTVAVSAVGRHRDYMNTFSSTSSFTLPSIIGEGETSKGFF